MSSMSTPVQETEFALDSGLKIRTFRKDPSKFFIEMESWMKGLKVGQIENMAITGDGAGYITLVIAYRETPALIKERLLQYDTLALVSELAKTVDAIAERLQMKDGLIRKAPPAKTLTTSDSPTLSPPMTVAS